jgi:hypothetical protein
VRIADVVLLVVATVLIVPALTFAGYLRTGTDRDPAGLMTHASVIVAGLGAWLGGIGGSAVVVGDRKREG